MADIRLCPKCKRPSLKQATNVSGWLAPEMFECTNCDYIGSFFIEINPEDYELNKKQGVNKDEGNDKLEDSK